MARTVTLEKTFKGDQGALTPIRKMQKTIERRGRTWRYHHIDKNVWGRVFGKVNDASNNMELNEFGEQA